MKTLYTAHATVISGRDGHAETDDGRLSVDLARPSGEKAGTNPEQLFACGYGACFGSSISALAKKDKIILEEIKVQAAVSLNEDENHGYFLGVALHITLTGVEQAAAENLVKNAQLVCPYSKATRNNVEVKLTVNGKELINNN